MTGSGQNRVDIDHTLWTLRSPCSLGVHNSSLFWILGGRQKICQKKGKLLFSYFLLYLLNYLSHRDVIYLILILRRFFYGSLKFNFTLELIFLVLERRKAVHFWQKICQKKLQKRKKWKITIFIFFAISPELNKLQRRNIPHFNP